MNFADLPVRRPVSTAMVFLGLVLLGLVALQRIPVELMPAIQGETLNVGFWRRGAEPEMIEREILLPLEARVSALPHVAETGGYIRGSAGRFWVRFDPGGDIKVRELELRRLAASIQREHPRGTASVRVSSTESATSAVGSFVMSVHLLGAGGVAGADEAAALFEIADQLLAPRFAAVPGVNEVLAGGGSRRQLTVTVDPARLAALRVGVEEVTQAVSRKVRHMRYAGGLESEAGRTDVLVDGRPAGAHALRDASVASTGAAKLGHVADVAFGFAPRQSLFRVNGAPAVGVTIFQEKGANLIRLGQALRERVDDLREEIAPLGLDLRIGSDAAELVEDQLGYLARLGLSGYLVAMIVLFLFLRDWRAVAVVGVAVPVSLLSALALLYIFGQSLNFISLIGFSMAVGLLIDNSIVVYEAVLRRLERGIEPGEATRIGLRRTLRAIAAASLTTAIVFLPGIWIDIGVAYQALLEILATAILLPLAASLLVAVGLVPVLAYRLAAPAALRRVAAQRDRRRQSAGLRRPEPMRILFTGLLAAALRRPSALLVAAAFAVLVTLVTALPIALSNSAPPEAEQVDEVRLTVRFAKGSGSVAALSVAVAHVEEAIMAVEGVDAVMADIGQEGASITVELVDRDERPVDFRASRIRQVAEAAAEHTKGYDVLRPGEDRQRGRGGRGADMQETFGGGPREVVLSGPETGPLQRLAHDVVTRLEAIPHVRSAWTWTRPGREEIWVAPNQRAMEAFGLTLGEMMPMLQIAGREGMRSGSFVLPTGREIPVVIERTGARETTGARDLRRLRIHTDSGVAPLAALTSVRQMPSPPVIAHHNGRRETSVYYRLGRDAPESGPARAALEKEIETIVYAVPRQPGYTIGVKRNEEQASLVRKWALPAILLLILVLAMAFESLTLPALVLLSLPLTLLGATWLLVLTGTPAGIMALAGAIMLFGLTVNPAILLVDRMQQRIRGGWSAGAAALASVRERTRPVLMTAATTIAALWPLALTTGRENEYWPPFATVVIGGLLTSTLLTLLVIPVGFILLQRLDRLFGRVGPWLVVGWLAATLAIVLSLTLSGVIVSMLWQGLVTLLVGGGLLAVVVLLFRQPEVVEPATSGRPPMLDVRNLGKVYGVPGPLRQALRAPQEFARRVAAAGGKVEGMAAPLAPAPQEPLVEAARSKRGGSLAWQDMARRFIPSGILAVVPFCIASFVQGGGWKLLLWMLGVGFLARLLADIRRVRGLADAAGVVHPGGIEGVLRVVVPWLALAAYAYWMVLAPYLAEQSVRAAPIWPVLGALLLGLGQLLRRSALRQRRGELSAYVGGGPLRYPRTLWRRLALRVGGFDLPAQPVQALAAVNFRIEQGMVGVLGPNGAGKTTLLRQLAGILDPSRGAITLGDAPLGKMQRTLARWVGYLPQDAGLPDGLSAREYLTYFAALYDLPPALGKERVEHLLTEVGLADKADDKIQALSGGMRQRVAVARTLLRLPPIIIVDEPTVGLDPRERIRFRNLLARLASDRIVLFSTHVVEDVAVACERVLVLARGRLVFDGEPRALSSAALGKVWEVRMPLVDEFSLPAGAILAEEAPGVDGEIVRRILAETAPAENARPLEARLEDGYLWLISRKA